MLAMEIVRLRFAWGLAGVGIIVPRARRGVEDIIIR